MSKLNLVLIVLVIASGAFFFWAWSHSKNQPPQALSDNSSASTATTSAGFEPKVSSDGWAEIEVTPLTLASNEWSFRVNLNAHQEMDVDLTKAATLTDDRGDTLTPVRWEEPNPGGHHRQGTLVFAAPASKPQTITLTVKDIGGAAVRMFTWQLQ